MSLDDLCLGRRTFWSINRQAWPEAGHASMPPPLAELESGRSYVAEIFNGTPHPHPMHLHGHTFRVLGSSARTLPPHWADTVLLHAKERSEEHTSELQSLMRISYAVFCMKNKHHIQYTPICI